MFSMSVFLYRLARLALFFGVVAGPAAAWANNVGLASLAGAGIYAKNLLWLDLTGYDDATAGSGGGQNFSFSLPDGSTLRFTLKRTYAASASGNLAAVAAPTYAGAVVGSTVSGAAYGGIPGKPFLYGARGGYTLELRNIQVIDSKNTAMPFTLFATDAEATGLCVACTPQSAPPLPETLQFDTNGGAWEQLEILNAINGSAPSEALNGIGTATALWSGTSNENNGSLIIGTANPTSMALTAAAGTPGLTSRQGVGFGIMMASISMTKSLGSPRANSSDQFDLSAAYSVDAAPVGNTTTVGATNVVSNGTVSTSVLPGAAVTLSEAMAAGSISAFTGYRPNLSCSNSRAGSTTQLPGGSGSLTSTGASFSLTPTAGDEIVCTLVNTHSPNLTLVKSAPETVSPSGSLTYTIGLGNSGQTASGATVTVADVLPTDMVANSVMPSKGVTSVTCGSLPSGAGATLTCTVTLSTPLAAGAANGAAAFTINATAPSTAGAITNYASTDPTGGTSPPTPGQACTPEASCGSAATRVALPGNPQPVPVDARWMLLSLGALLTLVSSPSLCGKLRAGKR